MIMVDLQQIGPVAPAWFEQEDLTRVLEAAQDLLERMPAEDLDRVLDQWEQTLCWISMDSKAVSDEWYVRALLVTCLRGLTGQRRPIVHDLGP